MSSFLKLKNAALGGDSPIKMTGVLAIPFRGYNLMVGNAKGAKM